MEPGHGQRHDELVRVYSPEPFLRRPGPLLRQMARDLYLSLGLAWQLAGRDIKAQYRRSLLGYLWALGPPLLMAASFILLHGQGVFSVGAMEVPYGAYVVCGMILWQIFADAVAAPLRLVSSSRDILVRVNFPREALVLAGGITTAFGALVRLLVIAGVLVHYRIAPATELLLVPCGMICLIIAGTCVGLLLTPVGMLYGDIEKAMPALLLLWMLLTPVAYPLSAQGSDSGWLALNFVTPLIEATRTWILGQGLVPWAALAAATGGTLAMLIVGWLLLRLAAPHLVARLGL